MERLMTMRELLASIDAQYEQQEAPQTCETVTIEEQTKESDVPKEEKKEDSKVYIPNFAFPFKRTSTDDKEKTTYDLMMEGLFPDKDAQYLFNKSGLFHGGVHLSSSKFKKSFDTKYIQAIADGKVIAYRVNDKPLENEVNGVVLRYTTSFFLIEHYMEYPKGNKLTFYSLYMHMASMDMYEFEEEFKCTTKGSKAYLQEKFKRARVKPEELLADGTEITISREVNNNRYQVLHDGTKKRSDVVSIYKGDISEIPKASKKNSSGLVSKKMKIDKVVELLGKEQIVVKAGDILGELGLFSYKSNDEQIVHLEVFTFDDVKKFQKETTDAYEKEDKEKKYKVGGTTETPIVQGWRNSSWVFEEQIHYVKAGTPITVAQRKKKVGGVTRQQVIEIDGSSELLKEGVWTIWEKQVELQGKKEERPNPNILYVPKDTTELFEKGYDDIIYAKVIKNTNIRKGTTNDGDIYGKKTTKKGTELVLGTTTTETKVPKTKDKEAHSYYRQSVLEIAGKKVEGYSIHTAFFEVIQKDVFVPKESKQKLKAPITQPIKNLKIEKDKDDVEYIEIAKYPSLYVKKYKDKKQTESWFTHGVTLKMFDVMEKEGTDNIGIFKDTVSFYDGREENKATQEEKETLNPLFNEILGKLSIDKDKNGKLEAGELAGLTLSQEKQKELSYMVAKHESEWENPTRFEKLATFMDEMKATEYAEMMRDRTKKLSFFDDVMAMDFSPTFFHPIALVGVMVRDCKKKKRLRVFDIEDAKVGLKYIYDTYGRDIARIVERIYRIETAHFTSEQYKYGATAGMEKHDEAPYYGWSAKRFVTPPLGTWSSFEGKGLSVVGGTKPNIKTKKDFLILDSVKNAMIFLAQYIKDYNGDYARWYRTDEVGKATYRARVEDKHLRQRIFDSIEAGTLVIKEKPYIAEYEDECEEKIEEVEESTDDICFPLSFIPKESYKTGMRQFASNRKKGRKHAGCDLYAPVGTKIYAMADGEIIAHRLFYLNTYQITVQHKNFIARYGEVRPNGKGIASGLKVGSKVKKGQHIGYVGKLVFETGTVMHMIHLELYSGEGTGSLNTSHLPFKRRSDLMNPTEILDKAKNNLPKE